MTSDDALQLIQAINRLAENVKEGTEEVTQALTQVDESISTLIGRTLENNETIPTAGQIVEKIADFGAKAVHQAITNWEKKLQGSI